MVKTNKENTTVQIKSVSPNSEDVAALITELDEHHNSIYPVDSHALESLDDLSKDSVVFLAAYLSDEVIACGAIKFLEEGYSELKRMYVSPKHRGKGIAKKIMEALEYQAVSKGFGTIKLETGVHQGAAKQLYRSFGFSKTTAFGSYTENPLSFFMSKELDA